MKYYMQAHRFLQKYGSDAFKIIAAYEEPHLPLPTYAVDTSCGYTPPLEWLEERILGKAPPQP